MEDSSAPKKLDFAQLRSKFEDTESKPPSKQARQNAPVPANKSCWARVKHFGTPNGLDGQDFGDVDFPDGLLPWYLLFMSTISWFMSCFQPLLKWNWKSQGIEVPSMLHWFLKSSKSNLIKLYTHFLICNITGKASRILTWTVPILLPRFETRPKKSTRRP